MSVQLVKDAGGLEKILLTEPKGASAELYLSGGQLTSWKNAEGEDLLFMSKNANFKPPKAIRGGIPIGLLKFTDVEALDQDGWARNRLWAIDLLPPPPPVDGTKSFVDLIMIPSDQDLKARRRKNFEFRLRVALNAASITVTSRIRNLDRKPFLFTFALHTYLSVGHISDVRIEGLETLNYFDNLKNGTCYTEQANDAVTVDEEMDRFYLNTPSKLAIIDHTKSRVFELRKKGAFDAVVWNPWDKKPSFWLWLWLRIQSCLCFLSNWKFGTEDNSKYKDYEKFVCIGAAVIEDPAKLPYGHEWKGVQKITATPLLWTTSLR